MNNLITVLKNYDRYFIIYELFGITRLCTKEGSVLLGQNYYKIPMSVSGDWNINFQGIDPKS